MKKVKFVKYHPLFAYSVGDTAELLESDVEALIKSEHVVEISDEKFEADSEKGSADETADLKPKSEKATGVNQRGRGK